MQNNYVINNWPKQNHILKMYLFIWPKCKAMLIHVVILNGGFKHTKPLAEWGGSWAAWNRVKCATCTSLKHWLRLSKHQTTRIESKKITGMVLTLFQQMLVNCYGDCRSHSRYHSTVPVLYFSCVIANDQTAGVSWGVTGKHSDSCLESAVIKYCVPVQVRDS